MACISFSRQHRTTQDSLRSQTSRRQRSIWIQSLVFALCFVGTTHVALSDPLQPKALSDESYGESFTAIADLSDGTYALLQYVFTNAGFGDGKAACRGLVVSPGKRGLNSAARFDRDEWRYDPQESSLTVGQCVLSTKGKRTHFKVQTEQVTIDLQLNAAPKPVNPPSHRIRVDDDEFYEAEVLIPWSAASAQVTTPTGKIALKGTAYLDHTRSNTRLPKVASKWLRFRGFTGDKPTLIEIRYSPKGQPSGWGWSRGDAKPTRLDLSGLKLHARRDAVRIELPIGVLQTSALIYRYRPAKEWGVLGRLAKPWVGDPETRTFRATLTRPDGTKISGIFEHALITQ